MAVSLEERALGGLRWIVARGAGLEVFGALGRHLRAEIQAVLGDWDLLARLRQHVSGPPGSERLAAVERASQAGFPEVWAELAAMAEGAGVAVGDLALLNFRGDLGILDEAFGCSDLAWRGRQSFIAHNEDDAGLFADRSALLTLDLEGQAPVTAFWKPGFLPSNAFAVTSSGLLWSIDHLPVAAPGAYPGRHFVARGLQYSAATVDEAIEYLRRHPSAGGYAYTIGDQTGRIVSVESVQGQLASREVTPGDSLVWHTNHGRYLPGAEPGTRGTSVARGQVLEALGAPPADPDPAWFLRVLAGAPPPDGARADPSTVSSSMTLCTFVAGLTTSEATFLRRGAEAVTIPLAGLARGVAAGAGRP